MKDIILASWNASDKGKQAITSRQLAKILRELPDIPVCFADMEGLFAVHRIDHFGTEYLVLTDRTQVGIEEV